MHPSRSAGGNPVNEPCIQHLIIWGLKCIGYNYHLERYLADHLPEANKATGWSRSEKGFEQK